MRFFTADTHFGSKRALELSRRPFDCTSAMDRTMIQNWNRIVMDTDEVYHLGDFGEYDVIKSLNGKIHLILGNYERKDMDEKGLTKEKLLSMGFVTVKDFMFIDSFVSELPEVAILKLVHEPSKALTEKEEVMNLFGHIHGRQMVKRFGLDVGVDCHNFTPITEDTVSFYLTAIRKHYDNEVFF